LTLREWKSDIYHLFYMNETQQRVVAEMKLDLPSQYRFDEVHPNSDARFIENTDKSRFETLRRVYECLPAVSVRCGNELIGVGASTNYKFYLSWPCTLPQEVQSPLEMRVWQDSIGI
uniref:GNAT family N-acetyltransferase n=1 Tax=Anisakis simplex TaxID=6269 RepID=A0A0M3JBQ0_ANISI